ncbi:hypothetical protein B6I64_18340 [Klebsiella pneumoniae]|nr:hypothetical protein B6I64_18340 [Klebsiella pneumoniae]
MCTAWFVANKFIILSSVPWGVLTILILPIASSATLFHKLSETKKNVAEDLSRDEQRRLERLIKNKSRATLFMLALQISIIVFVALISLGNESETIKEHIQIISKLVVCTLIFSLYSLIPVLLGVKEVIDFEGLIKTRKALNRRKKNALAKLGK